MEKQIEYSDPLKRWEKSRNRTGYRVDQGETWQKGAQAPMPAIYTKTVW